MKLAGKSNSAPNTVVTVIPRPSQKIPRRDSAGVHLKDERGNLLYDEVSGDLVFKACGVLDWEPLDKILPEPIPPTKVIPGQGSAPMLEDPDYKESMHRYYVARQHWLILQSLKATPDLEWTTVLEGDSGTWGNYRKELKDFGLLPVEINRIIASTWQANSLNDELLEAARKRFLAGNPDQN